jgi:FAD/FMN-containing dehydrogenase
MGLTGIITSATLKLRKISSGYITQKIVKTKNIDQTIEQFESSNLFDYSVAWIDCLSNDKTLGRSVLFLGEHAKTSNLIFPKYRSFTLPLRPPDAFLNYYSVRAFNNLYYAKFLKQKPSPAPLFDYFYPLDIITNWNTLYGNKGFVQYQFVIPKIDGLKNLKIILRKISLSKSGSFLAVLKEFGPQNDNFLSFPIEGYTLALDFKFNESNLILLRELDSIIVSMGGRIYLAKDALMSESTFKASYPNWMKFEEVREKYGAIGIFSSNQSYRIGLK